jgi:hypothetical protein
MDKNQKIKKASASASELRWRYRLSKKSVSLGSLALLWILVSVLFLSACNVRTTPQHAAALGYFIGKNGSFQSVDRQFLLSHTAGDLTEPRVMMTLPKIFDVNGFTLSVTRTGLPMPESFVFVTISQDHQTVGSDVPSPTIASGDPSYIRDHIGQVIRLIVDTDSMDANLEARSLDPFPNRVMSTGYGFLSRWEADDPCIPFADPNAEIDINTLATSIFNALSDSVIEADDQNIIFSLGGSNGDGDFELYFVPFSQHSTRSLDGFPSNGFTFIFKTTVSVALGATSADIYIPITFLFDRIQDVSTDRLEGSLDLIQFSNAQSDDRKRVTVTAEGLLSQQAASEIRNSILEAITNLPPAQQDALDLRVTLFSAAVNNILRPNGANVRLPDTARIVLMPNTGNGKQFNRLLPDAGFRPQLCILY